MKRIKALWLIFLLGSVSSFFTWYILDNANNEKINQHVQQHTQLVANVLKSNFANRSRAMLRMADRWEEKYDGTPQEEWSVDAENYVKNDAGYQAIEWVDTHGHVRWVVPLKNNEQAVGLDLTKEERRRKSLEKSRINDIPIITEPINLVQGGKGFLLFFPLFIGEVFDGYLLAVFNVDKWLHPLLQKELSNYNIKISYKKETLLTLSNSKFKTNPWTQQVTIDLLDKHWQLHLSPTQKKINELDSYTAEYAALFILLISGLFATFFIINLEKATSDILLVEQKKLIAQKSAMDEHSLVSTTDLAGTIIYVNDKFCHVSGYSKDELIGENHRILNSQNQTPEYWKNMYQTTSHGAVWHDEIRNKTKSGQYYWVDTTIVPNYDELKNLKGFTSILTDITERKIIEANLRDSEERFKTLYDNAPDMYISVNPDNGLIVLCNKTLLHKLGYEPNDIIGTPLINMYHEDCHKVFKQAFKRFIKTGSVRDIELTIKKKNNDTIDVSLNADAVRDEQGKILYSLSSWRDISEQKETQKQLMQAEKLASLGQLVAGISHEINSPLGTAVTNVSELTLRTNRFKKKLSEGISHSDMDNFLDDVSDFSSMASDNLLRAADLVRSFKLVAVDQSSEEQRTFNLKEHIEAILITLHHEFKRTDIKIIFDCSNDIMMDNYPGAISQVITNLVHNSLIHGFDQGTLSGEIVIKIRSIDDLVKIHYTDNGRGISGNNKEKIFDPFYTTRRNQGGSGLGMHVIHNQITGILGGSIKIKRKLGSGVFFEIVFAPNYVKSET